MSIKHITLTFVLCGGLAACGDTLGEQALGGGVVGAGVAAVTSGSIAQGAAIGAAGNVAYCQLNPGRCN